MWGDQATVNQVAQGILDCDLVRSHPPTGDPLGSVHRRFILDQKERDALAERLGI
jgi:hypothetical protein